MTTNRPLRVFLCHSSNDKPAVRELYQKLRAEAWIEPWLDEEELYPGQDWDLEIEKAVDVTDVVIVVLSKNAVNKEGYVQAELRYALDIARTKPEETIFIIPFKLEECKVPRRLTIYQYVDYFPESQHERVFKRLLVSLQKRADSLDLKCESDKQNKKENKPVTYENKITLSNGLEFMYVPAGKFLMGSKEDNKLAHDSQKPQHTVDIPYDYWMARFPVTNELYNEYVEAKRIKHPVLNLLKKEEHPVLSWWKKKKHPVINVNWFDAMKYCQWLNDLLKNELLNNLTLRLPTEAEWEKSSRGTDGREYPWGNTFDKNKCNSIESRRQDTTPVSYYSPQGDSPYGCADMAGNVSEWTLSLKEPYPYDAKDGREDIEVVGLFTSRIKRGSSLYYHNGVNGACCAYRFWSSPSERYKSIGFRVVLAPNLQT